MTRLRVVLEGELPDDDDYREDCLQLLAEAAEAWLTDVTVDSAVLSAERPASANPVKGGRWR